MNKRTETSPVKYQKHARLHEVETVLPLDDKLPYANIRTDVVVVVVVCVCVCVCVGGGLSTNETSLVLKASMWHKKAFNSKGLLWHYKAFHFRKKTTETSPVSYQKQVCTATARLK